MSDLLKSALNDSKITVGMVVDSRPPTITRGSGEVRNLKLTQAINSPVPAAARMDSEMRKSFAEMPGIIPFKTLRQLTNATA